MMVSFVVSFFPRGILDKILNLIESISEGFPSYSWNRDKLQVPWSKAIVSDEGLKPEVLSRIAQATRALTKLKPIWADNCIFLGSMLKLMRSLVISIFL